MQNTDGGSLQETQTLLFKADGPFTLLVTNMLHHVCSTQLKGEKIEGDDGQVHVRFLYVSLGSANRRRDLGLKLLSFIRQPPKPLTGSN